MGSKIGGFTLVELIAVLIIIAVLATTAINKTLPSDTFQLQASRDRVVAAFFSAQQNAMTQAARIRLTTSGNVIDVRRDDNNDSTFASTESVKVGGTQYPVQLQTNQTLTTGTFIFDRLGQTSSAFLQLSQNGESVAITISESGYAY